MLTIIPFKNVSKDKDDSYLQLIDKIRTTPPNELISNIFGVEKEQIYNMIFKTNDLSKLTSKSYEKNVKTLSEFLIIFANVFSQIQDLSFKNSVHNELFEKLINFVNISFQSLFKQNMSEAFMILVNLHKFLHKQPEFQEKIVNFIFEKFFNKDLVFNYPETINRCKDSLLELLLSSIEAQYEPSFYISLYVKIYNLFVSQEELPILNDKKIIRHANNFLKKGSNLPNEFIRLTFFLNYINPIGKDGINNLPETEFLALLPNSNFSFEIGILNSVIKSSFSDMKIVDRQEGNKNYGRKSCSSLLSNTALRIIHNKLLSIKETEISFSDLANRYSFNVEDLEEVLIDGKDNNLFELIVDYKTSKILIKYIKRNEHSKESIAEMKNKITSLKQKIINFKQRIDNLAN